MTTTTERLSLHYGYRVDFMPQRGRQPRRIELPDTVEVEVPSVSGLQAPEAVRVALGVMPYVSRMHAGRLYASADGGERGGSPSRLMEPSGLAGALFGAGGCPWEHFAREIPEGDVPRGARILRDARDATRKAVLARAEELLLVDGAVWVREREPAFSLNVSGMTAQTHLYDRERGVHEPGFVFGLDRREAFEEFVREAGRAGLQVRDGLPPAFEVVRFEPGTGRMPEDMLNAATALRLAVRAVGREIAGLPARAVSLAAEAAAAAERIDVGLALPHDAETVLARLAAETGLDQPKVAMICAVGRSAIALSMPSPEGAARLDALAEDDAGLSGLGPR